MVNAQQWLDHNYLKEKRKFIEELDISGWDYDQNKEKIGWNKLEGDLNLRDFISLKVLDCSYNQLTSLDLGSLSQLKMVFISDNLLTNFDYSSLNSEILTHLNITDNNLSKNNLSVFSNFTNLVSLWIGNGDKEKIERGIYNRWVGSLEPLQNCSKIWGLEISNTDINAGAEYLPESLSGLSKNNKEKVLYSTNERSNCRLQEIKPQIALLISWREWCFGWEELCFNLKESISWIKAGLTIEDYELADYLQREKNIFPQEIKENLEKLRKEYEIWSWKNIHQKFIPELRKEWEFVGLTNEQTKKWINLGLEPQDYDYVKWLINVKKKDAEWVEKNVDKKEELREEHKKHLSEIANSSRFGKGIHNALRKEAEAFLNNPNFDPKAKEYVKGLIEIQNKENEEYEENGVCLKCQQINTNYNWCQACNIERFIQSFDKWTSGNKEIDEFIKQYQSKGEKLEWIPYERFENIQYVAEGGFSKVYKAKWIDGFIMSWNNKDGKWKRNSNQKVILKRLNSSQNTIGIFLNEVFNHKIFSIGHVTRCYGISQDPETEDYLMVIGYMKGGNLRQYLNNYYNRTNFHAKLFQLGSIARSLRQIHEHGLIHKDFHPGNLLSNSYSGATAFYISDLGLCKPVDETNNDKVYGVLPYIAPEILQEQPYTQASDIYSFGIVAYEFFTGSFPFSDIINDEKLALKICQGLRPKFNVKLPQSLSNLIKSCWNSDPSIRPTISQVIETLDNWLDGKNEKDLESYYQELLEAKKFNETLSIYKNSGKIYHSQPINTKEIVRLLRESQDQQALGLELKKMEKELDKSFTEELKELVKDFIQAVKELKKDKKDKEARNKVKQLDKLLQQKEITKENIQIIIRYCERFIESEKQLEQEEQLQASIEIPTSK